MVHRVVVHQGGQVDQLDHRREGRWCAGRASPVASSASSSRVGPEHLALHLEQMRVDLGDQAEVRLDDAAELLRHPLEPGAHRPLQVGQGDRRDLRAHSRRPAREPVDALAQVHEPDVHRHRALVARDGVGALALRLERAAQPVDQADLGLVAAVHGRRRRGGAPPRRRRTGPSRRTPCPAPRRCGAGPRAPAAPSGTPRSPRRAAPSP